MKTAHKIILGTSAGLLTFVTAGSLYVHDKYLANASDTVTEIQAAAEAVADRAAREKAIEQALQGVPLQEISFGPGVTVTPVSEETVEVVNPSTLVESQGKMVDTAGEWALNEHGDIEIYRMNDAGDLIRIISTTEGFTIFAVLPTDEPLPMHNCRGLQGLAINGGEIPVQLGEGMNGAEGQCFVVPEPTVSQLITDGLYMGETIEVFGITITGDAQYAEMLDKITLGI